MWNSDFFFYSHNVFWRIYIKCVIFLEIPVLDYFFISMPQWLEQVLGWLSRVFASEVGEASTSSLPTDGKLDYVGSTILQRWRCHMQQFFCRIYVNMRIEELFSIIRGKEKNEWMNDVFDWSAYVACLTCSAIWNSLICISSFACVDFPESTPAVEDLKFCLERTNQRQQLLTSLKTAFETRLLHPGQQQISQKMMLFL